MKKIKRCKVKYMGKWELAYIVESVSLKEPAYLIDGDTVPILRDVLDAEPIEITDHRPPNPPGTKDKEE